MKQRKPQSLLNESMTPTERRATLALASIFALRMLGLFMILPVFTLYADGYSGYSATLAGLALGIYGLTQAMFQIPLGMLSDRVGRKPVIVGGLVVFTLGSILAAQADSLVGVVIGRAVQGAGAIAAAVLALAADLTREEHRTKSMAVIGASIGMAFTLALLLGPVISRWFGLEGLFWSTALLALMGLAILHLYVPTPVATRFHRDTEPVPTQFGQMLTDTQLLRLDIGILILHLILSATFVVVPLVLRDRAGLSPAEHWQIYLLVLFASVALMVPFIVLGEKYRRTKHVFLGAIAVVGLAQGGLIPYHATLAQIVWLMILFFAAFNILEASLPSLISRFAPPEKKGSALGVYSTSQFFGAFLGGLSGGWLYGHFGAEYVFGFCAALAALWLALAVTMRNPQPLSSHMLNLGEITEEQAPQVATRLMAIAGVAEAVVIVEDGIAYLKVDRRNLDEQALRAFSAAGA